MDYIQRYPLNKAHFCQRQAEKKERNEQYSSALKLREMAFENLNWALTLTSNDIVQESIKLQISHEEKLIALLSTRLTKQILEEESKLQSNLKNLDDGGPLSYGSDSRGTNLNSIELYKHVDQQATAIVGDSETGLDCESSNMISIPSYASSLQNRVNDALEQVEHPKIPFASPSLKTLGNSSLDFHHVVSSCISPILSLEEELAPLDCPPLNFV